MKRFTIIAILILMVSVSPAFASDGFTVSDNGKYEWSINQAEVLVVNTAFGMTLSKESKAVAAESVNKLCNEAGKSVYGQIMKHTENARVIITNRQIAIVKYGFPKKWDDVLPNVLKTLDSVSKDIK